MFKNIKLRNIQTKKGAFAVFLIFWRPLWGLIGVIGNMQTVMDIGNSIVGEKLLTFWQSITSGGSSWIVMIFGFAYLYYLLQKPEEKPGEAIEFFKDRSSLAAKASYNEIFNSKNSIYAWWVSGEGIFSQNEKYMDHVKQILLPRPDTPGLETFGRVQDSDFHAPDTVAENIRKVTRLAKAKNKDVKWFKGFNGYGITFCNPGKKNGWLHYELIMPGVAPENRSAIRIERSSQEAAYDNIYLSFNKMWNDAEEPKPYEYEKKSG